MLGDNQFFGVSPSHMIQGRILEGGLRNTGEPNEKLHLIINYIPSS